MLVMQEMTQTGDDSIIAAGKSSACSSTAITTTIATKTTISLQ